MTLWISLLSLKAYVQGASASYNFTFMQITPISFLWCKQLLKLLSKDQASPSLNWSVNFHGDPTCWGTAAYRNPLEFNTMTLSNIS